MMQCFAVRWPEVTVMFLSKADCVRNPADYQTAITICEKLTERNKLQFEKNTQGDEACVTGVLFRFTSFGQSPLYWLQVDWLK